MIFLQTLLCELHCILLHSNEYHNLICSGYFSECVAPKTSWLNQWPRWKRITGAQSTRGGHRRRIARCGGRYGPHWSVSEWVSECPYICEAMFGQTAQTFLNLALNLNVVYQNFTLNLNFCFQWIIMLRSMQTVKPNANSGHWRWPKRNCHLVQHSISVE